MSSSLFIIHRHHRYIYFHCFLSLLLSLQNHEIHELDIYTQYLISIQVFNPEGIGPATNVVVMTDEGSKYKLFITLSVHYIDDNITALTSNAIYEHMWMDLCPDEQQWGFVPTIQPPPTFVDMYSNI